MEKCFIRVPFLFTGKVINFRWQSHNKIHICQLAGGGGDLGSRTWKEILNGYISWYVVRTGGYIKPTFIYFLLREA
jgi:hypothetical protein